VAASAVLVFRLDGLALSVLVLAAALPTGSNAMLFAQRYQVREAEASTVIVLSTAGFMLSAPLWLTLLDLWRRSGFSAAAAG
jgi:predicted permease